ncbi:collagenase [Planococcus lenghuensis]|uniref:Tetratricopeptide repeat protein n=1 Tax=Planococcus lenghuensis TaxID=2213202 RepID=A0A1Q2KZ57_9BACL|nr:collagenase [Planococcus lenghuensis]AQQ53490.1 hypothetical protein B0X71_10675 [Planococcus lenghuensis]
MNSFMKLGLLLLLFIAAVSGSFAVIFNMGLAGGLLAAAIVGTGCFLLFGFSAWGLGRGHLRWVGLTNRLEVAGVLLFSLYLGGSSFFLGAANASVEVLNEGDHSAGNKAKLFARDVLRLPITEEQETMTRGDITYVYPLEHKDTVSQVDELLQNEMEHLQAFFGLEETGPLTVVLHSDYESIEQATAVPEAAGYYDFYSQSVHFAVEDGIWDLVFLHEYVHFLSHEYALKHDVSETRLPQWFEEGLADYLAGESVYWYDPAALEPVDFFTLDLNSAFHEAASYSFDPYAQSFLAVNSLASDFGEEALQQLLSSLSPQRFYTEMELITGMDLDEFEATFLEDEIAYSETIADLFDEAYEAYEEERFVDAVPVLEEIAAIGGKYEVDEALWTLTDIHLERGEFAEAIDLLERKLETGEEEFRIDDLLLLAEVHLLTDPAQALAIAQQVKEEIGESAEEDPAGYYYTNPDSLINAYSAIVHGDEVEGYRQLFDEGLLYNLVVWEILEERLVEEYPEEF